MTKTRRKIVRQDLRRTFYQWICRLQDGPNPIDCYIADNTADLMADAALAVLEAVEDVQQWGKKEGHWIENPK